MRKKQLEFLFHWLQSIDRKPLVLRGARQVGKTYLIRAFAKASGKKLLELNFEKNPEYKALFVSNDPKEIIRLLEVSIGSSIDINEILLFLDEIQVVPELLAKLRWFYEDLPALPVVAAGSLLDFVLEEHTFSMPVGRINYMYLEPFSFFEFLEATNNEKLGEYLKAFTWKTEIPKVLHEKAMSLFFNYFLVGGMPGSVMKWAQQQSFIDVQQSHHDLLETYRNDFAKYRGKIALERLDEVFNAVPHLLGKKFVFREVNASISSEGIKKALHLLVQARICHPVTCTAANGLPLAAEAKRKAFKMISLDSGLASAQLQLPLNQMDKIKNHHLINQGALSEQVVGQILRTLFPCYVEPHLYYWAREEKSASAEVDYLWIHEGQIIPIEVKAGTTGSLKSLHVFMSEKKLSTAVRINGDLPSQTTVQVKLTTGKSVEYTLLSLPFYLLEGLSHVFLEK